MAKVLPVKGIQFESTRIGYIGALARRESGADLRYDDNYRGADGTRNSISKTVVNSFGYMGYFQFGGIALQEIGYKDSSGKWTGKDGAISQDAFLNSRDIQVKAINLLIDKLCAYLRNNNINEYYGKIVNGIEITESGCIAGCHLVGLGALASFLDVPNNLKFQKINGKLTTIRHPETDGNQVHISKYIELLGGYDLETCCLRKIRVTLNNLDKTPLVNKAVTIVSNYDGRFNQGEFRVNSITDENGKLPVIIRHPGAKIFITIDGINTQIFEQKTDSPQYITTNVSNELRASATLTASNVPQPKPESDQTPQEARNQKNASQAEQQETMQSKNVRFNVQVVEGDSGKAISNMRFYLTYKGNIKEHRSDNAGIKQGIIAESGQDIEVAVAGNGTNQVIYHFTVQSDMDGQMVKIPLPVHSLRLRIVNESQQAVTNSTFMIFYRGRSITKKTDAQGIISLNMLTGFVYGFGLINGKKLVNVRCIKNIVEQKISINASAQRASVLLDQLSRAKSLPNPLSPVIQPKPANTTQAMPNATKQVPMVQQNNSHTETRGNPITTVSTNAPPSSDTTRYHIYHDGTIKRENKAATGYAEFIYYDQNGGRHNLGKSAFIVTDRWAKKGIKGQGKVYLIDQRQHKSYRNNSTGYKWNIVSSDQRYYLGALSLASVLGAMCSLNYGEYLGSGFSTENGGSGVSSSHINGINGDFRYLGINNRHMIEQTYTTHAHFDWDANVRFVNALYKFGYKRFLSRPVKIKNNSMLPYSTSYPDHHHHIHLQGFSPNVTDI
ncbi:hypothetical protein [Acinetobacter puyangensis]|uniref:hypothetical protein n=1 Tax=Acinetobacter puyangensis TaxID=1096779 RepID=UPI003A4D335E